MDVTVTLTEGEWIVAMMAMRRALVTTSYGDHRYPEFRRVLGLIEQQVVRYEPTANETAKSSSEQSFPCIPGDSKTYLEP